MRPLPLLALLAILPACDDEGSDPCAEDTIVLGDTHNFSFTGLLDLPSYPTCEGCDVEVDWTGVTDDIRCHAVDPTADVANVGLIRFPLLTEVQVEEGLSTNSLLQSDMSGYVEHRVEGGETSAWLSTFSFFGTQIDLAEEYTEAGGTYLVVVSNTTTPGVGALVLAFLDPTATEGNDQVALEPGCGALDLDVDLGSLTTVPVCADGPWVLDWSGLTRDGQGGDIALDGVDSVMLGLYEGVTLEDLEAGFLDIETSGTRMWTLPVDAGVTSVDLGDLSDGAAAFSGFDGDGIWLFALRCSRCYNPAPLFLTVLEPAAE